MSAYTIQAGDTLSAIAKRHNTTVAELVERNGIQNPDLISAGQVIVTKPPEIPPAKKEALKKATAEGEKVANNASKNSAGKAVKKCPKKCDKPKFSRALVDEAGIKAVYIEADGLIKSEGELGRVDGSVGAGLLKMEHAGHFAEDGVTGGSHKLEKLTAEAKIEAGMVDGVGLKAEAKAQHTAGEGTLFVGSDENNPWAEGGGEYALLQAEAKADILVGSDGKRKGLALGGKAAAVAAAGDLKGEVNIPIPFTDWTLSLRAKGGGSVGSVGVGGGAYGYKDLESERYHLGALGEAAALVGIKADVDLSLGPKFNSRKR